MKYSSATFTFVIATLLVLSTPEIDAKRKKNKSSSAAKSKTKTKWSTTMDVLPDGANPMLATEEHGYYIKRTFVAADGTVRTNISDNGGAVKNRIPYLAIPIAWFPCPDGSACRSNGYSAIFNTGLNALSDGFLCDDDCTEPYEPICGRTPTEVAVFYNKCKLNVAKCRTHGYWMDFPLEECQKAYPKELEYTAQKFKTSPYFKSKTKTDVEGSEMEGGNASEIILLSQDSAVGAAVGEKEKPHEKRPKDESTNQKIEATTSASGNLKTEKIK